MGENQGMIWIILGVIVIAAAVFLLGNTMSGSMESSGDQVSIDTSVQLSKKNAA